jgi:hypothetical protein
MDPSFRWDDESYGPLPVAAGRTVKTAPLARRHAPTQTIRNGSWSNFESLFEWTYPNEHIRMNMGIGDIAIF